MKLKVDERKKMIVYAVVIAIVFFILGMQFAPRSANNSSSQKVEAPQAKATQIINKQYSFPIKDDRGKEISKLKYYVEKAELQDEIIVKGQSYNAVKGKTFLILSLKLSNDYSQGIQINSKDYIRLSVNGSKELLAPEIHNDPVQVQAISIKSTRVGFTIDEGYKNLTLKIGEIGGSKDTVTLTFK